MLRTMFVTKSGAARAISIGAIAGFYAGDKLVCRFIKIDKLSTATGTEDGKPQPFRYGYGSNYLLCENPR